MQVTLPFFVLHGEADIVTDPEVSRALYDKASSRDKTIKLYPGMWHGLTSGEPDDNIEVVFSDIISWFDKRTANDINPIVVESIHTFGNGGIELTPTASPATISRQQQQHRRTHGSYFCGLRSRRLQHYSAM